MFFIVSLPEHGGEHEGEHDDGQAKGEHEGQEDPVVGRRGVEDDEVDQDAGDHLLNFFLQIYQPGDQGGAGDEHSVHEEPGKPEGGVSESNLTDQTSLCRRKNIFFATALSSGLCIKDEADHPQALLDPFLLLVDDHHQHRADELRHREGHIDRHHGSGTTSNKSFKKRELEGGV